jgi:hypothetical protein
MGLTEPWGDVHDDAVTFVVTAPLTGIAPPDARTHLPRVDLTLRKVTARLGHGAPEPPLWRG